VTADVNVTANFSSSVTITYIVGPNGSLSGSATQQVTAGGTTTPVTAVPEEGYLFSQWSDGSIDNPRTDADVTASLSVEATFFKRPIMLPVPQSTFVMGARDDGDDGLVFGNDDEYPRHEVTLSSYEIGKYEVTAQEYCDFLNYAGHPARNVLRTPSGNPWRGHNNPLHFGPDNVPIMSPALPESMLKWVDGYFVPKTKIGLPGETEYSMENNPESAVTWYGAVVYCNWLSERDGFEPVYNTDTWEADWTKNGYHIPTEAQWERAAAWDGEKHWIYGFTSDTLDAGRDRCTYYNGFYDPPPDWDNTTFTNVLGLQQDAITSYTNPVGWFNGINVSPNGNIQTVDSKSPIGAYDMSGNIMEWCNDWYSPTYYAESTSVDPRGPATGELRVMRGSGWHRWVGRFRVRTAVRFAFPALQVDGVWGFRLARTTGPTPEFTVNYTAGENGSITGTSPQIVDPGQSTAQVTAVPANGFGFVEWSDGRTDNPRTDINVREDISVTAAFATAVTLNYVAGPNGTLEGDLEQVVGSGASGTTVSAVPGDGFIFLNWSDGSTDNPRVDENATADLTVTANFVEAISLEYFAGPNGTLTGATSQMVALSGSGTEVSAVPESGFVFVDWSDGRTDNPRIDSDVETDVSVTANFGPE
jgi:formylglycine-generating enzyme required for sulfatase activity